MYFQGISIRCLPIQSGIQNSQRPACASAFCRGIDAGGAPFEMNKKRLTEEQRIANMKASRKASRARRKANGGQPKAMIRLTPEQRAINQAAATRRWQERNRETILEKARIAGRKRWRENKDEEKIRAKIARAKRKDKTAIYNAEWPGFRGADRMGHTNSPRLATDWIANPPKLLWKKPVGAGWSSFAVAGSFAFTQEQRDANECVACYDLTTGNEVWTQQREARFEEAMGGPGPRATPTASTPRLPHRARHRPRHAGLSAAH